MYVSLGRKIIDFDNAIISSKHYKNDFILRDKNMSPYAKFFWLYTYGFTKGLFKGEHIKSMLYRYAGNRTCFRSHWMKENTNCKVTVRYSKYGISLKEFGYYINPTVITLTSSLDDFTSSNRGRKYMLIHIF